MRLTLDDAIVFFVFFDIGLAARLAVAVMELI